MIGFIPTVVPPNPGSFDTRRCKLHDVTWFGTATSQCWVCVPDDPSALGREEAATPSV